MKITYDGTILESYPAQVKATKIEIKSAVPAARQKERKEHENSAGISEKTTAPFG